MKFIKKYQIQCQQNLRGAEITTSPYYTNLPNQNLQGYRLWSHYVYSVTEQIPKTDSCPHFCIFLAKEKQANKSPTYNPHTLAMFFLHSATALKY